MICFLGFTHDGRVLPAAGSHMSGIPYSIRGGAGNGLRLREPNSFEGRPDSKNHGQRATSSTALPKIWPMSRKG